MFVYKSSIKPQALQQGIIIAPMSLADHMRILLKSESELRIDARVWRGLSK